MSFLILLIPLICINATAQQYYSGYYTSPYYGGYYGGYGYGSPSYGYSGYGGYGYGYPSYGYSGYGGYGYGSPSYGYGGCAPRQGGFGPPGHGSQGCGRGREHDPWSKYFAALAVVNARLQTMQMLYGSLHLSGALGNSAAILLQ
ncbi:MAG: hypothetical protein ACMUIS_00945 [bacterium]